MKVLKSIIELNIKAKGTKLLWYGVILIFITAELKSQSWIDNEVGELLKFFGFTITFLGVILKYFYGMHINEKSLRKFKFFKYFISVLMIPFTLAFFMMLIMFIINFISFLFDK